MLLVEAILRVLVATNSKFLQHIQSPVKGPAKPQTPLLVPRETTTSASRTTVERPSTKTTSTSSPQPWILVTNEFYLRHLSWPTQGRPSAASLLASNFLDASLVDFLWTNKTLYIGDMRTMKIVALNYDDGLPATISIIGDKSVLAEVSGLEQIAVDWLAKKLYFINKLSRKLVVCHLNATSCTSLLTNHFTNAREMVVHPRMGYLFYSEISISPYIARVGLDGSDHRKIVDRDLAIPAALAVDFTTNRLFWGDQHLNEIWSCDLDGNNRRKLPVTKLTHIFSLDVFQDWVVWTDWNLKQVIRANKDTGQEEEVLWNSIKLPTAVKVIHPDRQPMYPDWTHPCSVDNGGCSHLCLLAPGGETGTCACPESFQLQTDGKTCEADCRAERWQFRCGPEGGDDKCIEQLLVCDGRADCRNGADERNCTQSRICEPGQFQCGDGACISMTAVCDGRVQCQADNSDEFQCATRECPEGQFQCRTGLCLPIHFQCDGNADCPDYSDENPGICTSTNRTCMHHQFQCSNGRCIQAFKYCDGRLDCEDRSDEPTETCMQRIIDSGCPRGSVRCGENTYQCIPQYHLCNGRHDCTNQMDENRDMCLKRPCPSGQFKCVASGVCIPNRWMCDAEDDCGDNSDEAAMECKGASRPCTEAEFRCASGKCIHVSFVCTGRFECPDGGDENPDFCRHNWTCPDGQWKCDSGHCIPAEKFCDRRRDCIDLSDELRCDNVDRRPCDPQLEFECSNNICIHRSYVCDGDNDCGDNSDETPPGCTAQVCQMPRKFWCAASSYCINVRSLCDKEAHCSDAADEDPQLCSNQFPIAPPVGPGGGQFPNPFPGRTGGQAPPPGVFGAPTREAGGQGQATGGGFNPFPGTGPATFQVPTGGAAGGQNQTSGLPDWATRSGSGQGQSSNLPVWARRPTNGKK